MITFEPIGVAPIATITAVIVVVVPTGQRLRSEILQMISSKRIITGLKVLGIEHEISDTTIIDSFEDY